MRSAMKMLLASTLAWMMPTTLWGQDVNEPATVEKTVTIQTGEGQAAVVDKTDDAARTEGRWEVAAGPERVIVGGPVQVVKAAPKTEKGTYLGVAVSRPAPALRKQLGLPPGFGLVVDNVADTSPAQAADVHKFDVLAKFDDQQLVNVEQLLVLVRAHKSDDVVHLTLLRDGKPVTVAVKLQESDVVALDEALERAATPGLSVLPDVFSLEGWPVGVQMDLPGLNGVIVPGGGWTPGLGTSSWTVKRNGMTIKLGDVNGSRQFTVTDNEGKVLFDGPVDTEEDRQRVPEEYRTMLEDIEKRANSTQLMRQRMQEQAAKLREQQTEMRERMLETHRKATEKMLKDVKEMKRPVTAPKGPAAPPATSAPAAPGI